MTVHVKSILGQTEKGRMVVFLKDLEKRRIHGGPRRAIGSYRRPKMSLLL